MRAVLIGAVQTSAALLQAVVQHGLEIVSVVTLPPVLGQRRHADYADLAPLCRSLGVPCHQLEPGEDEVSAIRAADADLLLVWGWSRMIEIAALEAVRFGGVGFHPAPLPLGRGRHPIIWSILLGLNETAVTFFRLTEKADEGEILVQRRFPIVPDDDAQSLLAKVNREAAAAMPQLIENLRVRGVSGTAQDEGTATIWRKRNAEDGRIDFRMTAEWIGRLVRALVRPYPGADARHHECGVAKVWRVAAMPRDATARYAEPGRVIGHVDGAPIVACSDAAVALLEHDFRQEIQAGSWFC